MTNVENQVREQLWEAIRIDAGAVRDHLDELVKSTVEDTLNSMLEAEADEPCKAKRYDRAADLMDTRAGC